MVGLFKKKTKGFLKYFDLVDWWEKELTNAEREIIRKSVYSIPSDFGMGESLDKGDITSTDLSKVAFIAGLSPGHKYFNLSVKLLEKAEKEVLNGCPIKDQHFLYQQKIEFYYKKRENPDYLNEAIKACKQQITIADKAAKYFKTKMANFGMPTHHGYYQLCVILEKKKDYDAVIELCKQAQKQEWAGDWDNRLKRCLKKKEKAK